MELHLSTFVIISISFFFAGIIDAVSGGGAFILLAFTTLTKLDLITASGNTKDSDGK